MIDYRSKMGFQEGSPWENANYNIIKTPQGTISMANTKKKLKALILKQENFFLI